MRKIPLPPTTANTSQTPPIQSSSISSVDPNAAKQAATVVLAQISQYPFLSLVPINRTISSYTPTSSHEFTYEGISLKLPWSGTPKIQTLSGVGTQIKFPNNEFVMLPNPYPDPLHRQTFLDSIKTNEDREKFNYLFGEENLNSNSAFFNLVLNSSPTTLSSTTSSPKELLAQSMLLPIKLTMFFDSSTQSIYQFSTPDFKVFEFTDLPAKNQSFIYLYDARDNGRLITTSANQNEIDFILSSIKEQ
ncbi:MAG: hypothetical protein KGJ13_00770 [Patescibacteria group bacterium]|nr:hypothetical protein [Patescibacteria group bacterium]